MCVCVSIGRKGVSGRARGREAHIRKYALEGEALTHTIISTHIYAPCPILEASDGCSTVCLSKVSVNVPT